MLWRGGQRWTAYADVTACRLYCDGRRRESSRTALTNLREPQASPEHHGKHGRHSDSDRNIKQSIAHGSPFWLGQTSARDARKLPNSG
jgi:hypothetical protein